MENNIYKQVERAFNAYKYDPDIFKSAHFSVDHSISTKIEMYSLYGMAVLVARSDQFELRIEQTGPQKISVHIFEHEYPIWEFRLGGYRCIFFDEFKTAEEFETCFKNFRKHFPELKEALYRLILEMV